MIFPQAQDSRAKAATLFMQVLSGIYGRKLRRVLLVFLFLCSALRARIKLCMTALIHLNCFSATFMQACRCWPLSWLSDWTLWLRAILLAVDLRLVSRLFTYRPIILSNGEHALSASFLKYIPKCEVVLGQVTKSKHALASERSASENAQHLGKSNPSRPCHARCCPCSKPHRCHCWSLSVAFR